MSVSDSDNDMLTDDGFTVVSNNRREKRRRVSESSEDNNQRGPEREERIPPVILTPGANWQDLICQLRNKCTLFTAKFVGKKLHILANSVISFRIIQNELANMKMPFHTFPLKDEAELKAVLRGIPGGTDTGAIKRALEQLGFNPTHVSPFYRRETVDGEVKQMPTNTFMLRFRKTGSWTNIWKLQSLMGVRVRLDVFKPRPGLPQCYRCQRFHHSSAFCCLEPRCVKCGGPHLRKNCTDPSDSTPKCCNCGGAHPASWKGCPAHKRLQQRNNKEKLQQQKSNNNVPAKAGPTKAVTGAMSYAQAASRPTTSNQATTAAKQTDVQDSKGGRRRKNKKNKKSFVSVTETRQPDASRERECIDTDTPKKIKALPRAAGDKTAGEQVQPAPPARPMENSNKTPASPTRQLAGQTSGTDAANDAGVKPGYVSAASILKWTATIIPLILGPSMTPNELLAAVMQSLTVLIN